MTVNRRCVAVIAFWASIALIITACSREDTERMLNKQTYQFTGVFENQYNDDLLEFSDAKVTLIREGQSNMTKSFSVKDNYLTITMRNSSKEKRDDIVMRIHGQNELLTCSVCARHHLATIWQKRDFTPLPVEDSN